MIGHDDFAGRVGHRFEIHHEAGTASAVLVECRASDEARPSAAFSVTFRTTPELPLEQGTYLLGAAGLEPEPVFLVPVAAVTDDPEFAAVFEAVFSTADPTSGGT